MPHPTVKAAIKQHFLDLYGFADEAAAAAGNASVRLKFLGNDEDIDEPKTQADQAKAHLFVSFEPSVESGGALGEMGFTARRDDGLFYIELLTAAGKGEALADAKWEEIKASLRIPMIVFTTEDGDVVIHLNQDFAESDRGNRFGGRWAGIALSQNYSFDFSS